MANSMDVAKLQAREMFLSFSEILKKRVQDSGGAILGNVWDISIKLGEVYPKVDELIIVKGFIRPLYASVKWSAVSGIEENVILNIKKEEAEFAQSSKEYEFLLRRDMLDQQVVDTFNHKVRRVNDVHLLRVDHELVVAHVDIGLRGLLRRLGWERVIDIIVKIVAKKSKYLKKDELVSWKYIQPVSMNPASMTMKLSVSQKQIQSIPAADLGDIIFDLTASQRMALFRTLDVKTKAKVFENLEFDEQKAILKELDKKEAAQIVSYMSPDEATDLLERLPRATVKNLLTMIESTRAKKISTLLGYSSDSAGGLMTTDFVSLPDTMSVQDAIEYIRTQTKEVETVSYIYIVDEKSHLKGMTTIRRLLFAEAADPILKTALPKTFLVYLNNSAKEIAYSMEKYRISAIPVVDENKILHGIITVDDILSQIISIAWRKRPRVAKGV